MSKEEPKLVFLVRTETVVWTLVEAATHHEAVDMALAGDCVDLIPEGASGTNDPQITVEEVWQTKAEALHAIYERKSRPDYDSPQQALEWGDVYQAENGEDADDPDLERGPASG